MPQPNALRAVAVGLTLAGANLYPASAHTPENPVSEMCAPTASLAIGAAGIGSIVEATLISPTCVQRFGNRELIGPPINGYYSGQEVEAICFSDNPPAVGTVFPFGGFVGLSPEAFDRPGAQYLRALPPCPPQ